MNTHPLTSGRAHKPTHLQMLKGCKSTLRSPLTTLQAPYTNMTNSYHVKLMTLEERKHQTDSLIIFPSMTEHTVLKTLYDSVFIIGTPLPPELEVEIREVRLSLVSNEKLILAMNHPFQYEETIWLTWYKPITLCLIFTIYINCRLFVYVQNYECRKINSRLYTYL